MNTDRPRLRYRKNEPPCGWTFKDPDTNFWLQSLIGIDDLIQKTFQYRQINGLPVMLDLEEKIETSICCRIPADLVIGEMKREDRRFYSLYAIQKHTQNFLQALRNGGTKLVQQEEAERRGKICLGCEFNRSVVCIDCVGIDVWIRGWAGERKTHMDNRLQACVIDGIFNLASIHADVTFRNAGMPEHCWKRGEGVNA